MGMIWLHLLILSDSILPKKKFHWSQKATWHLGNKVLPCHNEDDSVLPQCILLDSIWPASEQIKYYYCGR